MEDELETVGAPMRFVIVGIRFRIIQVEEEFLTKEEIERLKNPKNLK